MARFDFDVTEYDAPQDFGIIPEGTEVRMKCTEAEDKETSAGGEMIAATFQIVEGEYKGRKIWTNFNIVNKSEKAQNFGRRMVAGWARACGKPNAKSTDELLEKSFWCKMGVEKSSDPKYKDKNVIANFLTHENGEPSALKSESKPATGAVEPESTTMEAAAKPTAKSEPAKSGGKKQPWDD